jgi:RNA polymerase sigma-70 factor, ECF subfamily
MNSHQFKEKLLLIRLKKKDPNAYAEVYDLYVTPIYRFIYFKVATQQDAEDLTSEVFLKIWQYITETDHDIDNLRALLYRTARNLVIDSYRRKATRDLVQDIEILENIRDEKQQTLLLHIETVVDMRNMERVLRKMKDEYREVLILRYIDELSIAEIANVLEKTKGSVRVLIHRALKVARDLAEQASQTDSKLQNVKPSN